MNIRSCMPPEMPLDMPVQDFCHSERTVRASSERIWTWFARSILLFFTAGITGYGVFEIVAVMGYSAMTLPQGIMAVFFTLTFAWISLAAASTLAGLCTPQFRFREKEGTQTVRTALVMPIHNENPAHIAASLQIMAEELKSDNCDGNFEIVVLSDTTDADMWIAETMMVVRLRKILSIVLPVWYRRRWYNTGKKPGNIEDFVKRWGGRYTYMIILDADSFMVSKTMTELVNRMQADPEMGLIQTIPRPLGQGTFFASLQQFAGWAYMSSMAKGLAAWSGDDSTYWGHNAIIRVSAFAQACGLPQIPGKKPFAGYILSHDFIEAALMRRAGWKLRLATDLDGSFEECPPTLIEVTIRDRRWAQGNLQHSRIIHARGFSFVNRTHLFIGIMNYLSAVLWLTLILTGFALTLQALVTHQDYFSSYMQLFPHWPSFDAHRMMRLFIISVVVLLFPKITGIVQTLFSMMVSRKKTAIFTLLSCSFIEIVFAALCAPVRMMIQTYHIFQILSGKDSGWKTQARSVSEVPWTDAIRSFWKLTCIGVLTSLVAFFLSPVFLAWMSPVLLSLILSIPISKASGSTKLGRLLGEIGIFQISWEEEGRVITERRDKIECTFPDLPEDGLRYLARNIQARTEHFEANLPSPAASRGKPNVDHLAAERKILEARSLDEALGWLTPAERMWVAGETYLLELMATLPD